MYMKDDRIIAVFSFTREANKLNRRIQKELSDCGYIYEDVDRTAMGEEDIHIRGRRRNCGEVYCALGQG